VLTIASVGEQPVCATTKFATEPPRLPTQTTPAQQRCPGKYTQFCGGFGSGQLYKACTGNGCFQNANIPAQATAALGGADTATTTFASSGTVTKQMSTTAAVATTSTSVDAW